ISVGVGAGQQSPCRVPVRVVEHRVEGSVGIIDERQSTVMPGDGDVLVFGGMGFGLDRPRQVLKVQGVKSQFSPTVGSAAVAVIRGHGALAWMGDYSR